MSRCAFLFGMNHYCLFGMITVWYKTSKTFVSFLVEAPVNQLVEPKSYRPSVEADGEACRGHQQVLNKM